MVLLLWLRHLLVTLLTAIVFKRYTCVPVFWGTSAYSAFFFFFWYARVFAGIKKCMHLLVRRYYAPVMLCMSVPRCLEVPVHVRQSSVVHARVRMH